ncbi:MAG: mobile mystery protein A [Bacteriovoracaceae bacterium]|nr:mobile mystery protein A [Bacteriovoracaceae bacterium]
MKINLNSLTQSQIERRLDSIRETKGKTVVSKGWIQYIRKAMGLTIEELAKLTGLSARTVAQAQSREVEGKITLSTLKKMADAMECDLVYSLIPKKSVTETIKNKAREKARKRLAEAGLHMKLEDQGVEGAMEERVERLALKLIENGDVW